MISVANFRAVIMRSFNLWVVEAPHSSKVRLSYLSTLIFFFTLASSAMQAQDPGGTQILAPAGIQPYEVYQHTDVDSVNLTTGNVNVHIPLVSFPQLGDKLKLNFVIRFNEPQWYVSFDTPVCCGPTGTTSIHGHWYLDTTYPALPLGADVVRDQGLTEIVSIATYPCFDANEQPGSCDRNDPSGGAQNQTQNFYTLRDRTGASHMVGLGGTFGSLFIPAPDGSGWTPNPTNPVNTGPDNLTYYPTSFLDDTGVRYTPATFCIASNCSLQAFDLTDPHGYSIVTIRNGTNQSGWTDSVGRNIPGTWDGPGGGGLVDARGGTGGFGGENDPFPGVPTTDFSGCDPALSTSAARVWVVPSISTATSPRQYKFCYSDQTSNTAFGLQITNGAFVTSADDATVAVGRLLRRVILPNGQSYDFTYDSYFEITKIAFPTGGSVSYQWGTVGWDSCVASAQPLRRVVTKRTAVSLGNNPDGIWNYQWAPGGTLCNNPVAGIATGVRVTKPDGNDEVHSSALGVQTVYYYNGAAPSDLSIVGSPIRTVITHTAYFDGPFVLPNAVVPNGSGGFIGGEYQLQFPGPLSSITTTLDDGSVSTINYTPIPLGGPILFEPPLNNPIGLGSPYYSSCMCLVYPGSTQTDEYNFGAPSGDGSLLRSTRTTYRWRDTSADGSSPSGSQSTDYLAANLLNIPSKVQIYNGSNVLSAETDYKYDETALSSGGAKGDLTTTTRHIDATNTIPTTTQYNAQGMVVENTDGRGVKTHITYDSATGSLFPQYIYHAYQTPLQETETFSYDENTGKLFTYTDANSKQTTYVYNDPLDRLTGVTYPDSGSKGMQYTDGSSSSVQITTATGGSQGPLVQNVYYDGFGRTIKTTVAATGYSIVHDTVYDGIGRKWKVSNPYFSTNPPTDSGTVFTYDPLGRIYTKQNPDTTAQNWRYTGATTTFTDESSVSWIRKSDSLGRLVQVTEPGSLITTYRYNSLGDLTNVNQSGMSTETPRNRTFTYDWLSRLVCSSNPETSLSQGTCPATASPSQVPGTIAYSYDLNGNLQTKTDSRSVTTTYGYDFLNRLTSKSFTGIISLSSCYSYDAGLNSTSVANSVGRLVAEWTQPGGCPSSSMTLPSNVVSWKMVGSYDPMGRLLQETQCSFAPCANPNTLQYSYDLVGNLTTAPNGISSSTANGLVATSNYDSAGRLSKVYTNWSNASLPSTLFEADQQITITPSSGPATYIQPYGPFGLTGAQYGVNSQSQAAVLQGRTYDVRGRVTGITVDGSQAAAPGGGISPITMNVSPLPQGVVATAYISCDATCGSGSGYWTVDGHVVGGFTYVPNEVLNLTVGENQNLPLGSNTIQVFFNGDATHPPLNATLAFNVFANTLPIPSVTAVINPLQIVYGQSGDINITVGCGSACGTGVVYVDGNWANWFILDNSGTATTYISPGFSIGQHTLTVLYFGNSTYSNATSIPYTFNVISADLSPITMTQSPIPQGNVSQASISCDAACGSGTIYINIDGQAGGGGTYVPGETVIFLIGENQNLAVGHHTMQIFFSGDATHPPQDSGLFGFDVIANTLPVPTMSVNMVPNQIPEGESAAINLSVGCAPACGGGPYGNGHIYANGNYMTFFFVDGAGNAVAGSDSRLPQGHYALTVNYFGSASISNVTSPPYYFDVVPNNLPVPNITFSLDSTSVAVNTPLSGTVNVGCSSACGSAYFYIDGTNWAGGAVIAANGTITTQWGTSGLSLGQHTLTIQYLGNTSWKQTTATVNFTVTP